MTYEPIEIEQDSYAIQLRHLIDERKGDDGM
jgi:hypothetical protein